MRSLSKAWLESGRETSSDQLAIGHCAGAAPVPALSSNTFTGSRLGNTEHDASKAIATAGTTSFIRARFIWVRTPRDGCGR